MFGSLGAGGNNGGVTRVFACGEDSFALPLTSKLGLTAVRSRSRENNTQLFSNTLAPLRYALCGENVNQISLRSARGVRIPYKNFLSVVVNTIIPKGSRKTR